jgi:hypothetical protein
MSGGTFDYKEMNIIYVMEEIDELLKDKEYSIPVAIRNDIERLKKDMLSVFNRVKALDKFLAGDTNIKDCKKELRK